MNGLNTYCYACVDSAFQPKRDGEWLKNIKLSISIGRVLLHTEHFASIRVAYVSLRALFHAAAHYYIFPTWRRYSHGVTVTPCIDWFLHSACS